MATPPEKNGRCWDSHQTSASDPSPTGLRTGTDSVLVAGVAASSGRTGVFLQSGKPSAVMSVRAQNQRVRCPVPLRSSLPINQPTHGGQKKGRSFFKGSSPDSWAFMISHDPLQSFNHLRTFLHSKRILFRRDLSLSSSLSPPTCK